MAFCRDAPLVVGDDVVGDLESGFLAHALDAVRQFAAIPSSMRSAGISVGTATTQHRPRSCSSTTGPPGPHPLGEFQRLHVELLEYLRGQAPQAVLLALALVLTITLATGWRTLIPPCCGPPARCCRPSSPVWCRPPASHPPWTGRPRGNRRGARSPGPAIDRRTRFWYSSSDRNGVKGAMSLASVTRQS